MVFNYIIKSYKGIKLTSTGELLNDVKKDVVTSPIDALKVKGLKKAFQIVTVGL